jgi:hypothetical protein
MAVKGSAEMKRNLHSTLTVAAPLSFLNLSYNEVQRQAKPAALRKCLLFSAVCARWQKLFLQAEEVS